MIKHMPYIIMEQLSNDIRVHWHIAKNIGDTLTPIILSHFLNKNIIYVDKNEGGKLLGVGSILNRMQDDDIIWGSGSIYNRPIKARTNNVLALRGRMSARLISSDCKIFGDPALLLPLIYDPEVEQKNNIGICPHYIDKKLFPKMKIIDIEQDYKSFIREIKSYKKIISSSLHGLIIAEAYGIQAEHKIFSNNVIGKGFKFKDYLTGTNRTPRKYGIYPRIKNLKEIQDNLIESLLKWNSKL